MDAYIQRKTGGTTTHEKESITLLFSPKSASSLHQKELINHIQTSNAYV